MSNEHYCLRWNNHQPNFISAFSNLLCNESLVDITLAAEGKYIQAHKVVLSACSSYFQLLFTTHPGQHPIVILKDVKYSDLKIVVEFMYLGEVNVSQDQLPGVLKTAETLQVKGLADMPDYMIYDKPKSVTDAPGSVKRKKFRKSCNESGSEVLGGSSSVEEVEVLGPAHLNMLRHGDMMDSKKNSQMSEYLSRNDASKEIINSRMLSQQQKSDDITDEPPDHRYQKRSRILVRQERVKRLLDSDNAESEDDPGEVHILEKQYSEPTPQSRISTSPSKDITASASTKNNLLAVPQNAPHLTKQNSDSILSKRKTSTSTGSKNNTEKLSKYSKKVADLDKGNSLLLDKMETRSNHCPALRPGPSLGCNFCWNTIDPQGRILRRKTNYHCPECRANLCIVPCFQDYHNKRGEITKSSSTEDGGSAGGHTNSNVSIAVPAIVKTSSL